MMRGLYRQCRCHRTADQVNPAICVRPNCICSRQELALPCRSRVPPSSSAVGGHLCCAIEPPDRVDHDPIRKNATAEDLEARCGYRLPQGLYCGRPVVSACWFRCPHGRAKTDFRPDLRKSRSPCRNHTVSHSHGGFCRDGLANNPFGQGHLSSLVAGSDFPRVVHIGVCSTRVDGDIRLSRVGQETAGREAGPCGLDPFLCGLGPYPSAGP